MRIRTTIGILWLVLGAGLAAAQEGSGGLEAPTERAIDDRPNVVVIFADDLGYGDLGCYGHPTIRTPHLDRMAQEGQRWTDFYVAAPVCTPSRAALLTGRLPVRNGMTHEKRRVLFPDSTGGLPDGELTIAELVKERGYATACVGKWHLGHLPPFLPTRHGFDEYFGIPYSNDMNPVKWTVKDLKKSRTEHYNVPLLRGEETIEQPCDQTTITRRYTEEAVRFIRANRERPFFLYLAHSMPHVPLFRSEAFANRSRRGLYGDVIEEIDWSVGQVLATLRKLGLDRRTLVVFSSDNGPWLMFGEQGGSAGILRGGKGGTFEGGMREPGLFWWPGRVEPGVIGELGSTMDLLPTIAALADAAVPDDRVIDGVDLRPALFGEGPSPRETVLYYRQARVYAARSGPWKAHFITQAEYKAGSKPTEHETPLLYHLEHDPGEKRDVAAEHPEVIAEIREIVRRHRETLRPVENQLAGKR